jgi:hypothetical protein
VFVYVHLPTGYLGTYVLKFIWAEMGKTGTDYSHNVPSHGIRANAIHISTFFYLVYI